MPSLVPSADADHRQINLSSGFLPAAQLYAATASHEL